MRSGTIAFTAGILCFQQLPVLPHLASIVLLPVLLWLAARPPHGRWQRWLRLPAWAGSGFLWTLIAAHLAAMHPLPRALEGRDLGLTGYIASLPVRDAHHLRFEVDVQQLVYAGHVYGGPRRVLLSWYGRAPVLRAGERWRLTVRLKRPHGFMNPGGFDYEAWLFRRGIRATGYVRSAGTNRRLSGASPAYAVQRLRQWLRGCLDRAVAPGRERAVLAALTLGQRSGLSNADWVMLRRTGTSHLLAISGLHIGLVAGLIWWLISRLWALFPSAAQRWPAPKAGAVAALTVAVLYSLLAGFSLPTERALIMLAVVVMAVLAQRAVAPSRTLATAFLAVLIFDPLAVMAPGLWLSFGAVAIILYGMTGRRERGSRWRQWARIQWVVGIGLLPMLLWLFQRASLVSPLANLLAVPVVSLLVVPLSLLGLALAAGAPALGAPVLHLAAGLIGVLWRLLAWLAALPAAQWSAPPASALALATGLAGVVVLLAPRGVPGRWLGLVLLGPLLLSSAPRPPVGAAWFTLLDVGQGLAAVVQTHGHVLVFDTGARFNPRFDAGEAVVVPFLRYTGWRRLDMLIVSHGDNDHIGGAKSLLAAIPAVRVLSSVPGQLRWVGPSTGTPKAVQPCRRGDHWRWDGVEFRILNPRELLPTGPGGGGAGTIRGTSRHHRAGNNHSCVLRVSAAGHRVLLTGDIERPAEDRLLTWRREGGDATALAADVLVAPHHGSKTSSSPAFVRAVAPRYVLFPVGYRNRYHFPNPRVVARYRALGIARFDSAKDGAITFRLGPRGSPGDGLSGPFLYRRDRRRYWHSP